MPRKTARRSNRIGTRAKVYHGKCLMTAGGLKKEDLERNKYGRIVSRKKHLNMKAKYGGDEEPTPAPAPAPAPVPAPKLVESSDEE